MARGPGRPPLVEPRNHVVHIGLTARMYDWVQQRATVSGRSMVDFIRETVARESGWYDHDIPQHCPHCAGRQNGKVRHD